MLVESRSTGFPGVRKSRKFREAREVIEQQLEAVYE